MNYRIGTRGSKLALVQTAFVRDRLERAYPDDTFETVVIKTKGDAVTDRPIAAIGDNALFTREIEQALLEGRIDLAVHSMKDLASACPAGLTLAKAWPREDPRDVFIARDRRTTLENLPIGATVATGSPRRDLLLRRLRPDLTVVGIRGNVDTRLRKLFEPAADEPHLDGLVLAAAGLKRLGREREILQCLPENEMIPAANQGQLAIELRASDEALKAKVDALGDDAAETVATAERAFLREIGADCHVPVGAFARVTEGGVKLRCVFARSVMETPAFADVTAETPDEAARRAAAAIRRQVAGRVTLVGAGPGDPGLITVKGLAAIKAADAIVYDRLISDELLAFAKPGCELVYVGKQSGNHTLPQTEINALLVRKAMTCGRVVRLKGGDPFVFGRGGEEVECLVAHGVRCEVVPGVTSAVAAPASVGIPVTHRGVAQGFEVVTAHAAEGESLKIDFSRLADSKSTAVFLMGLRRVGEIAAALVAAGRPRETPAAVVSAGTTPGARCVEGTLGDIAAKTEAAGVASPAILVVGEVVKLRARLGFPLAGRRFLVPEIGGDCGAGRAGNEAVGARRAGNGIGADAGGGKGRLVALLRGLGAEVDELEVGRIVSVPGALTAETLAGVTWLVFSSRNGLLPFDAALVDEVRRREIRIAAIGKATAAACAARGLKADFVAAESTGEGMLGEFRALLKPSDFVLHPTVAEEPDSLARIARDGRGSALVQEGRASALARIAENCRYMAVGVYRNEATSLAGPVDLGRYDAAFFTCASSARRVFAQATGSTKALAIGPATRTALAELGANDIRTAATPSVEALADLAEKVFSVEVTALA